MTKGDLTRQKGAESYFFCWDALVVSQCCTSSLLMVLVGEGVEFRDSPA